MKILAIALLLALAGCLTDEPETVENDLPTPTDPAEDPNSNDTVSTGTGVVVASGGPAATSQGGGTATVEGGARILFVEWAWDDPVIDLDGALSSPSAGDTGGVENIDHTAEGGSPGSPNSPHSLTIQDPETGTWSVSMIANGAAAQTEYRFAATVFYSTGTVPDGYTAL